MLTTDRLNDMRPLVSVVVLNYNGDRWLERCLRSLQSQTIFSRVEVIVADNLSTDGSDRLGAKLVSGWPNGAFIQHGRNLGYCAGNNQAALAARGDFLFFLNNDAWLEPDCLETLVTGTRQAGAAAACPLILNYDDDAFQSLGAFGFDLFGLATSRRACSETTEVLMPEGCAYLIERKLFQELGGFDSEFFMYVDEFDLSWRVWITGHRAVAVPRARLHHRGAAQVNPQGGGKVVELRTSDSKRFYANRNSLLVLLKGARHLLLMAALLQVGMLALEALAGLVLIRRWTFVRRAYLEALTDCWRLRKHVMSERRRLLPLRRRGDWFMLRFLKWRFNRWDEIQRARQFGLPKVTAK